VSIEREKDIEQLRKIALVQQTQLEQLHRILAAQSKRIDALQGNPGELQQALALLQQVVAKGPPPPDEGAKPGGRGADSGERKPPKQRTQFGSTSQPALPHVPIVYKLDDADHVCPACGGGLEPMEGQFEPSEMVDVVDVSYRIVQVQRQKYVCRCGGCVETAPGPERVTPGGRYSLLFAIKVAIDKYLDHIPLARQERILSRHGLSVTRQALWEQLEVLARKLKPIDDELLAHVMRQSVIGLDQTSWPRLEQGADKPWQMWCLTAPGVVVHRIRDDKSAATFKDLVGGYQGAIVCDALKTHEAGARDGPGITLAGCWAHVFRKFEEAEPDHPEAALALRWIGQLYEIDERAGDDAARRAELRRTESVTVLEQLKNWLWSQALLKTLSIGKAAAYTIANWERLTQFTQDPLIPLDNNATERGIRGPVVGRKNHYGSKSRRGTEVAATLYTMLETAKLHRVDPAKYLLEAVRAAARGEVLLPWELAANAAG
jgi:transposase